MQHHSYPIGVYDSGLGGLSIVKQIMARLPYESILYVADTARVPYGPRSSEEILRYNQETVHFLLERGVKRIICACNTSTAIALKHLQKNIPVPISGLIHAGATLPPGIKRVALIATEATVKSKMYRRLLQLRYPFIHIYEMACPDFVQLVEKGMWQSPEARDIVQRTLQPLLPLHLDALILGCSHYPYLQSHIRAVLGPEVRLIDPASRVVTELSHSRMTDPGSRVIHESVRHHFCTTGEPHRFQHLAEQYLGQRLKPVEQIAFNPYATGGAVRSSEGPASAWGRNRRVLSLAL